MELICTKWPLALSIMSINAALIGLDSAAAFASRRTLMVCDCLLIADSEVEVVVKSGDIGSGRHGENDLVLRRTARSPDGHAQAWRILAGCQTAARCSARPSGSAYIAALFSSTSAADSGEARMADDEEEWATRWMGDVGLG